MSQYRLLQGEHIGFNVDTNKEHRWRQGEIIRTNCDLSELNPPPPLMPKFELLHEARYDPVRPQPGPARPDGAATNSPVADAARAGFDNHGDSGKAPSKPKVDPGNRGHTLNDTLELMTVNELKKHAEEEEIPLPPTAKSKEDILKVIRSAATASR